MEIRVYSFTLSDTPTIYVCGLTDSFRSFTWRDVYAEPGEYELHMSATEQHTSLFVPGRLIEPYQQGDGRRAKRLGVVESVAIEGNELTVKGRGVLSLLSRRVVKGTYRHSGSAGLAIAQLISSYAKDVWYTDAVTVQRSADGVSVDFQATYKNVLDLIEKLAKAAPLTIRATVETCGSAALTLDIAAPVTRSVIFSPAIGNLSNARYEYNDSTAANYAFIGGQGQGSERIIAEEGDTSLTRAERREIFVNASQSAQDDQTLEQYKKELAYEGAEKITAATPQPTFTFDLKDGSPYLYGTDYDLGDTVSVVYPKWGVSEDLRITEVEQVWESGYRTVKVSVGSPLPEALDITDN